MKSSLGKIVFFFVAFLAVNCIAAEYVVKRVLDGDTIQTESGEIIRYLGIDAPEIPDEFYAREAARYNRKLVSKKEVRLEFDVERKDQYGRLLAYVFIEDLFVNGELVKRGYAKAMVRLPNLKYRDILLNYQKEAIDEGKGLWQERKKETESIYVGNSLTYILHRPSCKWASKISDKNRIVLYNSIDATRIGYSPCKICKP
jgi:micrococcal nuclease